jgi:spore germination protein YaaH
MYKKIIALSAAIVLVAAGTAYAYDVPMAPYKDVTDQSWEKDYVYTLSALGVVAGYPDSGYHPKESLSREAFIKLLATTAKLDTSHTSGAVPADVTGRWSAPYVSAAAERHWIDFMVNGVGEFQPAKPITREEVAALVGKYLLDKAGVSSAQWAEGDWTKERDARAFPDGPKIDATLAPYVFYTVNRTVMVGDNQGFRPKDGLMRNEAAVVVNRLIDIEAAGRKLEVTGYYAIQSNSALGRMPLVDNVAMGWSHLEYDTAGTAKLGTDTTSYKVPDGYESVVAAADQSHVHKDLVVYYGDGQKLSAFLQDVPAQEAFIAQLTAKLADPAFGFSGVSLDLEGLIDASDAANYLHFVQEVKAAIGAKTLAVAVPTDYYYKGYDLKGLADTVDSLILMAYDFTDKVSEARLPSAPLPLVRDGLDRALAQGVPADKLVLGISKQANQWVTVGGKTTYTAPDIPLVEKRLTDPNAAQTFSLPYFLNLIRYQEGGVSNVIYYEDSQSIAKKIWLAKVYGLKGISLWYMGRFTASDWDVIAKR